MGLCQFTTLPLLNVKGTAANNIKILSYKVESCFVWWADIVLLYSEAFIGPGKVLNYFRGGFLDP